VRLDSSEDFFASASGLQTVGPSSAGVENVPCRLPAADPTGSRVVVAKPVNNDVPKRLKVADEQTFAERNENFVHDKPAAPEIRER
jgi:hypothetical protein